MKGERAGDMYLLENHTCKCYFESCVCTCTYFSSSQISLIKTRHYSQSHLLRVLFLTLHSFHKTHYLEWESFIYLASCKGIWTDCTIHHRNQELEIAGVHADAWRNACTLKLGLWSAFPCEQTPYPYGLLCWSLHNHRLQHASQAFLKIYHLTLLG